MNSSKLLVAVVAMQGLILLGQWTGSGPLSPANAQVPEQLAQREQTVEQLKELNAKMDRLIEILDGGKLQVRLATPDENKR